MTREVTVTCGTAISHGHCHVTRRQLDTWQTFN